jgi:Bacteriophage Sf6, terminase small subunit-like
LRLQTGVFLFPKIQVHQQRSSIADQCAVCPTQNGTMAARKAAKASAPKRRVGRPSAYSEKLVERICRELMQGKSLIKICDAKDMPDRVTVIRWLERHPEFATRYARARESQADLMDDLILDVAEKSTNDTAAADRVKIGAYQWRAAKLKPKKYGEKVAIGGDRSMDPITTIDLTKATNEQLQTLEAIFGPLAGRSDDDAGDQGGESEEAGGS